MSSTISSQIAKTIEEIRRADYEGDRIALKTLFADLEPYIDVPEITARALYWRGFAMWRSAIIGFNDGATPGELEESLAQAMRQFEDSLGADTDFIEAKIRLASSTGLMAYLQRRNDDLVRELTSRTLVALKEIQLTQKFANEVNGSLALVATDKAKDGFSKRTHLRHQLRREHARKRPGSHRDSVQGKRRALLL